ncbi:type I restriction enzyme EcoKI subunit R [Corynebacterium kalinowskii]|uniref:Type I restriction enzyme EcoKI subunit R n=1 Tax=Corynebacterium kalinowskii TaxID=2675216 RepID=A0A6B8W284_9CORY|nr:DEAD/DEAH box helicase [Corynebacterium kalinowskii]QGU01748.1 type I restriction enzyme EcoKI subunit R [Corynebacterium kalinowskii]
MSSSPTSFRADLEFGFINNAHPALEIHDPRLIANFEDERTMLAAITNELRTCNSFQFSIAFITPSGLALLKNEFLKFKGRGTIITSRYLDFNEPSMFRELLNFKNIDVHIYQHPNVGFHAKGYVFEKSPMLTAIVGSSNLTDQALVSNQEWNLRFSTQTSGNIAIQLESAIARQLDFSVPLTESWIRQYEATRRPQVRPSVASFAGEVLPLEDTITPNSMQKEALNSLAELCELGARKAIIVSATGTGKTILAALAAKEANPKKLLFVVHREQIASKALEEFQKVFQLPDSEFGRFSGARREIDRRFVFATIQTLTQPAVLESLPRDYFDYIIIDESHHSAAESFRKIIDHFDPEFLLGLTATPERTDKFNIFELYDYNVAYEIRLQRALEEKMLVPFHYFGVADYTVNNSTTITETSNLAFLVCDERVRFVIEKLEMYGLPQDVRGLMFCSRKEEAHELSRLFNQSNVFGKPLRTLALTGDDSREDRERAVALLENGELDYIITVDIFNEGIDIPCLNQIVMLRATQSSIIFTQQLGRGLRKFEGKDHLRVIDFIGNYSNNFLIPIALFGDNSRNKDNIRKKIIGTDGRDRKAISGVSSVNFDEIAESRILMSLAKATLNGKFQFKTDILTYLHRHGTLPRLIDFARFDLVDPVLIGSSYHNYWSLLSSLKFVESTPSPRQKHFLDFLSSELLNGKRPHELLVLKRLLVENDSSRSDLRNTLSDFDTSDDESVVESALRVLSYKFITGAQRKRFGENPIVISEGENNPLNKEFAEDYANSSEFRTHVDDIIETGLFLARHRYSWNGSLVVGERYSRKDVCRLLNWQGNNESTIYGYKRDRATASCPIFVTYHKDENVDASVSYGDKFKDPRTLHWFTRSRRTLSSDEVVDIVTNSVEIHVFVKKDDAEGTDFFYLGQAVSTNAAQTTMPGNKGEMLNVVNMDLILEHEVEPDLFNYFETSSNLTGK